MSDNLYRSHNAFRKAQLKRMANGFILKKQMSAPSRWCAKHPASVWGKNKEGKYYAHCYEGYMKNQQCEVGEMDQKPLV